MGLEWRVWAETRPKWWLAGADCQEFVRIQTKETGLHFAGNEEAVSPYGQMEV